MELIVSVWMAASRFIHECKQQQQLSLCRWRALIHKSAEDLTLLSSIYLSLCVSTNWLPSHTYTHRHTCIYSEEQENIWLWLQDWQINRQIKAAILGSPVTRQHWTGFDIFKLYYISEFIHWTHIHLPHTDTFAQSCGCFCTVVCVLWSPLELSPVLHARASIWWNVSEHNEQAGQGAVSPWCRQIQTHWLDSSSQPPERRSE